MVAERLLRLALRLVGEPALAEDVLQETFLTAMARADRYDSDQPLMPWLVALLGNEARRLKRDRRRIVDVERLPAVAVAPDPVTGAADREMASTLVAAIADLPARYQPVLQLRLLEGLAHSAIARSLDRPVATVRIQLMRGLRLLRRALPAGVVGVMLLEGLSAQARQEVLARVRAAVTARVVEWAPSPPCVSSSRFTVGRGFIAAFAVGLMGVFGLLAWAAGGGDGERVIAPAPTPAGHVDPLPLRSLHQPPVRAAVVTSAQLVTGSLRVVVRRDSGPAAAMEWVRIRSLAFAHPGVDGGWRQLDRRGEALVHGLPAGTVEVLVESGVAALAEVVASRLTEVELSAPAGHRIVGAVVDDRGEPVPLARIWLSAGRDTRRGYEVTRADAAGVFAVEGVMRGQHLAARSNRHAASPLVPIEAVVDAGVPIELRMTGDHGRLAGVVQDAAGRPVAAADVVVEPKQPMPMVWDEWGRPVLLWPPLTIRTDTQGRFEVAGVPPGPALVRAWAPRLAGVGARVEVRRGATTSVDLTLRPAAICGRIIDGRGEPVAGARIHSSGAAGSPERLAITDADGRYRLEELGELLGQVWVDAGARGVIDRWFRFDAQQAEIRWDAILAGPRRPIRGALARATGAPLTGWTIELRAGPAGAIPKPIWTVTDRRGQFAWPALPRGNYLAVVLPPGGEGPCGPVVTLRPSIAGSIVVADAWLPTAGIRGRVTAPDGGDPPAGVEVTLTRARYVSRAGESQDHVRLALGRSGRFQRLGLPPGRYDVSVYAPGYPPELCRGAQLQAAHTLDVPEFRMRTPGRVRILLEPKVARLIKHHHGARICHADGVPTLAPTLVRDGAICRTLAPGEYQLLVGQETAPVLRRSFRVRVGEETTLHVALP